MKYDAISCEHPRRIEAIIIPGDFHEPLQLIRERPDTVCPSCNRPFRYSPRKEYCSRSCQRYALHITTRAKMEGGAA